MLDVAGQPGAGERLLHDPAVVHVLVEVHQQQAAVEERPDDRLPGNGREVLVPVGEHFLGGVWAECGDRVERGGFAVVHRTELSVGPQHVVGTAPEDLDEVAQHRHAVIAHHGFQAAARRRLGEDELRPLGVAQSLVEQSHPGDGVERRGEPAPCLIEEVPRGVDGGHRCSLADTVLGRYGKNLGRYGKNLGRCGKTLLAQLTAVKFSSGLGVVQGEQVSAAQGTALESAGSPRRRGDKQRHAIVAAVRQLLQEKPFAELSVSTISERAGVARSGFYFYFDSKYAVLAQILGDVAQELEELTGDFAPRGAGETPAEFARRMVGSAAAVYAHNDPVMSACNSARSTDAEIREILDRYNEAVIDQIVPIVQAEIAGGTADPITADVRGLVRMLSAATALTLSGESLFLGPQRNLDKAVQVLENLWLHALWGGQASG